MEEEWRLLIQAFSFENTSQARRNSWVHPAVGLILICGNRTGRFSTAVEAEAFVSRRQTHNAEA